MALKINKAKPKTSYEYVPIIEKGVDNPFTIMFDRIPLDELAVLQDDALSVNKEGEYSISINTLNYQVLKLALTGWKNVETDEGVVIFKRDNAGTSDGSLSLIPGDIRGELATVIIEVSKDLSNAEEYLKELEKLAVEDNEEEEDVVEEKPKTTKRQTKKTA